MEAKIECPYGFSRHLEHTTIAAAFEKVKARCRVKGSECSRRST